MVTWVSRRSRQRSPKSGDTMALVERAQGGGVLAPVAAHLVDGTAHRRLGRIARLGEGIGGAGHGGVGALVQGAERRLLAGEVEVERRARQARLPGDVVHGQLGERLGGEQPLEASRICVSRISPLRGPAASWRWVRREGSVATYDMLSTKHRRIDDSPGSVAVRLGFAIDSTIDIMSRKLVDVLTAGEPSERGPHDHAFRPHHHPSHQARPARRAGRRHPRVQRLRRGPRAPRPGPRGLCRRGQGRDLARAGPPRRRVGRQPPAARGRAHQPRRRAHRDRGDHRVRRPGPAVRHALERNAAAGATITVKPAELAGFLRW